MLMIMDIVFYIILSHWVADFLFQSRWMAVEKCSNIKALISHVAIYTITMAIMLSSANIFNNDNKLSLFLFWIIINGLLHFATDFCTSKITKRLYVLDNKHLFFAMIGFDQVIHYGCLLYTYALIFEYHITPYTH